LQKLTGFVFFMAVAGYLSAQTAGEMDRILVSNEITYAQATQLVLMAANVLPSGGNAFAIARGNQWLSTGAKTDDPISADDPINLGELSLLIMKAFNLKGGIFYSFFPGPRYACRELVYRRLIQGRTDPDGHLDGRTLLQILGRVLAYTGDAAS
jgi:hypothetical protein